MGRKIVIENIAADVTATQLAELIDEHGRYDTLDLTRDDKAEDGEQVAFVNMKSAKHGRAVIAALDGKSLSGKPLKVRALKHQGNDNGPGLAGGPSRRRFGGMFGGRGKLGGRFR